MMRDAGRTPKARWDETIETASDVTFSAEVVRELDWLYGVTIDAALQNGHVWDDHYVVPKLAELVVRIELDPGSTSKHTVRRKARHVIRKFGRRFPQAALVWCTDFETRLREREIDDP